MSEHYCIVCDEPADHTYVAHLGWFGISPAIYPGMPEPVQAPHHDGRED